MERLQACKFQLRPKAGLNRSILDQGRFEFRRAACMQAGMGLAEHFWLFRPGIPVRHAASAAVWTNATDLAQAEFKCTACGVECNADHNAALNILTAGRPCQPVEREWPAPALKQEPAYGAAR